ncbi:MAG: GNAT family N-acetyltransferase [Chloroflexota bacterium]
MTLTISRISPEDTIWSELMGTVKSLNQTNWVTIQADHFQSSHMLVATVNEQTVGFLRFIIQRLGEDEERPPIAFKGKTLYEAKIIAFGVVPEVRNQGIGRMLQEAAQVHARELGCYQIRSRSSYGNDANYHLKIDMGFAIQPSLENDSVYFMITL